jgi:hypothetical protein
MLWTAETHASQSPKNPRAMTCTHEQDHAVDPQRATDCDLRPNAIVRDSRELAMGQRLPFEAS